MTATDKDWFALLDLWELIGHPDMQWDFGDNDAADPNENWEED